jgi:hypothetical protein
LPVGAAIQEYVYNDIYGDIVARLKLDAFAQAAIGALRL